MRAAARVISVPSRSRARRRGAAAARAVGSATAIAISALDANGDDQSDFLVSRFLSTSLYKCQIGITEGGVRSQVNATGITDNGDWLLIAIDNTSWINDGAMALADADAETRRKARDLLFADEAGSVSEALAKIAGHKPDDPTEKAYRSIADKWRRLPARWRRNFIRTHRDEIVALLKEEGAL